MISSCLHCFTLIMKMNHLQLAAAPLGRLIEECNWLIINYFDEGKQKAEKVRVAAGSYDYSVLLRDYVLLKSLLSFAY